MSLDSDALLAVGHQCSAERCHLVDFLPFKCQHCEHKFCGEHYLPAAHHCDKYDESQHNRIAPSCPLCNTPVAMPSGQDPNIRMEQHISSECPVMTGKSKISSRPHCANARCKKVLYAPIPCGTCEQQFCAQHRFPADHKCSTSTKPAPNTQTSIFTGNLASETSARSAAAMAAIKRSIAAKPSASTIVVKPPTSQPQRVASSSASTQKPAKHNPFSKTDRRAKAERESRLKAMEERAKKGLLSEDEKAILVAERKKDGGKDDCVVT